jgi:putative hydrolase of the HAD superfamily
VRYLVWDFDGTLAQRPGQWSGTLHKILSEEFPHLPATRDDFRPHTSANFPWHTPDTPRIPPHSDDEWWQALHPVLTRAFESCGRLCTADAQRLAARVRGEYLRLDEWRVFDDTIPVLTALAAEGWTHVVLSNHVPELEKLIDALGLAPHFEAVFNSAKTGYEKPHPEAYAQVRAACPRATRYVMVGDNIIADVRGARAFGWPAVLVRNQDPGEPDACASLTTLPRILAALLGTP